MIPARAEAEGLLAEAELQNPGAWGNHSRVVAHCAEKIAEFIYPSVCKRVYWQF